MNTNVKKLRNGIEWEYNPETKLYFNHFSNKWVTNPRQPAKGKAKGKSVGKAIGTNKNKNGIVSKSEEITIYLNKEAYNLVMYHFGKCCYYKQELILYFLYLTVMKREAYLHLFNKVDQTDKQKFITPDGEQRGVYHTHQHLSELFGKKEMSSIIKELRELELIELQQQPNKKNSKQNITHYVPTFEHKNLRQIILHKRATIDRVNRIKTHKNEHFKLFISNTKKFEHPAINRQIQTDEYYSFDKFAGRRYSPISNLTKGERPNITQNGKPTVELDIKNSNPLVLFIYLKYHQHFNQKYNINITIPEFTPSLRKELNELSIEAKKGEFYELLVKKFDVSQITTIDLLSATQMTKKGLHPKINSVYKTDRDRAKQLSNYILFGSFDSDAGKFVYKMVASVYPEFAKLLRGMKRSERIKDKNYKNVSWLLHTIELELISEVCYSVDFPVTTIHDSFIAEISHKEDLKKAIKDVYRQYKFIPKIKASDENEPLIIYTPEEIAKAIEYDRTPAEIRKTNEEEILDRALTKARKEAEEQSKKKPILSYQGKTENDFDNWLLNLFN